MESAGPGKACTFSGFDYRGFKSLLHTNAHKDTHRYTNRSTDTHTLPGDRGTAELQAPRQGIFTQKTGGVAGKGQFLLLKIPTEKVKTARPACAVITQETVEKCKKRGRKKCKKKKVKFRGT